MTQLFAKNHSQTTLKFHTWNSDIVLKMSRKCKNCLSSTLMECGIWMKETNISPEVRFVTAGTASGSINFCQTCKFLHFYYKFVCVLSPKLLKFGEIKGVKFLSRKSGGVNFLTNLMSVLADGNLILGAGIWPTYLLEWPWALNRNPFKVGKPTETNIAVFFNIVQKGEWGWGALMVFFLTFRCSQATLPPFVRAPLENMAFLTNLSIPWPKGKFFDREKWFLTYLIYI